MYGDHRMEILSNLASEIAQDNCKADIQKRILECVMTDEAVRIINSMDFGQKVFEDEKREKYYNYEDETDANGLKLYEGMLIKAESDIRNHIRVRLIYILNLSNFR